MQLTPEIKLQLAEQKKQCVFCKLIFGEIPNAKKVFEDNKTVALLDIYPAVKGHIIYLLKEHYPLPAYVPGDEFEHQFALIPGLSKAITGGMVRTGINLFMAVGGAAGQQAPHFMVHFLPREEGDGFYNFMFKKKGEVLNEPEVQMLQQNLPIMMKNYFCRHPASWHTGKGDVPFFLTEIYENSVVVYEDEKVLCVMSKDSAVKGHLIIYSKTEEKYIKSLSQEDSTHLFFVASFASTSVFESLKAHGTNIIMKSGESDDNLRGKLEVHVLPRWQGDHLQGLMWQPKQASYDLGGIAKKIKDQMWQVKYIKKERVVAEPKEIKIEEDKKEEKTEINGEDEIKNAIEQMRR